jgi:hypothetical protein
VDADVVRLAAITLTCLFTAANPGVRDRATKALANLLAGAPELLADLQNRFSAIRDPEVQNRLVTVGSGQSFSA